jgi:hypothetical protein
LTRTTFVAASAIACCFLHLRVVKRTATWVQETRYLETV